MGLTFHSLPKQQITVTRSGTDYQFEDKTLRAEVVLRENAVSYTRLVASDYESKTFLGECDIADNVKVEFKFLDGTDTWTQVSGGWIEDLKPSLDTVAGEILGVAALGYGIALKNMMVREQYGTQSLHSTLNTIKEVLTDATYGIVPKYVNKVMATATDSGYSINTTKVADLTSDFKYLYFPGKPAIRCIEDMMDLIRAANVPNAGAHWIVVPSGTTAYLCLATVGAHENPPADVWPTWWNTDQAGSTIEVKQDMIVSRFHKRRSEANYIFFSGNYQLPTGEYYTENHISDWDKEDGTLSDDATVYIVGSHSVKYEVGNTDGNIWVPKAGSLLGIDITQIGTTQTTPTLSFYFRKNGIGAAPNFYVYMIKTVIAGDIGDFYYLDISDRATSDDEWTHITLPVGPKYATSQKYNITWSEIGSPNWNDINAIGFGFPRLQGTAWIDQLRLNGIVARAAYDSTKIGTQKCRIKPYHDNVPKGDSLVASDDSGQIAQFCKAELYRSVTEPLIGQIVIPMQETMLPGQLAHIHFGKKSDGSFRVDKDMRIIEVKHVSSEKPHGFRTYLSLTDDVLNSHPLQPTDAYNKLMDAVAPGFQDRMRGSLVSREIDIEQTILAKNYST